jgi:hypothetical protein
MTMNPQATLSIVAYKPRPGKEEELLSLVHGHVLYLREIGCATERQSVLAKSADGTIIEVFEWTEDGLEKAHQHTGLKELWTRFSAACDFVPLQMLEESKSMFANFTPMR